VSRAVVLKSARDSLVLLLLVLAAIVTLETLYVLAMGRLAGDLLDIWRKIPFLKDVMRVLVGVNITGDVSATTLITLGLVHPVLLATSWAFLLTVCTRDITGDIDTGTADLVLTLPLPRRAVYIGTTVVWVVACAAFSTAAWCGIALGEQVFHTSEPLALRRLVIPVVNLCALLLAIGGVSMLVAALSSRRVVAVAIMLGILLASFLVNFLEVFVEQMRYVAFLGFLHYYRPVDAVRTGQWPLSQLAVLLIGGAIAWSIGLWRFNRRDIPAV